MASTSSTTDSSTTVSDTAAPGTAAFDTGSRDAERVAVNPAAAAVSDDRTRSRSLTTRLLLRPEIGSLVAALVIFAFFTIVAPSFRNVDNTGTVLYNASTIGIMAVPVALLMIGDEFDLSAGVLVTTSGLAAAELAWWFNLNVWVGVLLALLVALGVGAINGLLLTRTRLPSFLTTLATFFVLQGVNLGITRWVAGGVTSPDISDMSGYSSAHKVFAAEWTLSLPSHHQVHLKVTILFWLVLTIIGTWVLLRHRFGNWIFAVGGDEHAARASGVPVRRTKVSLYLGVAFCAWLMGMHNLFNYQVVQSGDGVGNEFIYIIAAVIGGCLLTGGMGSVVGAAVGALIYGMTQLGINYAGWNPDWFKAFLGVMLLGSTLVNVWLKRKAEQR